MNIANKLTMLRIFLTPVFVIICYLDSTRTGYIAAAVFAVASITDAFDGYIARKLKQVTNFGKLLDAMADKILVCSAILILVEWGRCEAWLAIIIIGREFVISALRSIAAAQGNVIAAGMAGKVKTVIQTIAVILLLVNNAFFADLGIPLGEALLYISAAISVYSAAGYLIKNIAVIKNSND
ncbi:MAG: CDP-diacylglycerol--glycerol-3-phosphate 3-phosphatidyltransferase [Christensenellales bacterium]|jgi:CDP-diacylglycerol--glycerol-3-phosphate 3-phosphatidyltransferase